jgi:molybdopterin converting factor small subunit
MKVLIPTPLHDYTKGQSQVQASGSSIAEVLADLDRKYPGIRFRMVDEQDSIRGHMRVFVNGEDQREINTPLKVDDEVMIVQALSGG